MDKNRKYLRLYIKDYTFANSDELYRRQIYRMLRNMPQVKTTKLYAIVRTKTIAFDKKTFSIDKNYEINCNLLINEKVESIQFNLLKLYYEQFGQDYNTFEEFKNTLENYLIKYMKTKDNMPITKDNLHKQIVLENIEDNDKNLMLICPFYYVICGRETPSITINIYRILNGLKINWVNELEIIYIGKSMKDTMKRLKNHNKWGEILNLDKQSKENYDYLIYVFNIDKADTHINHVSKDKVFVLNLDSEMELKTVVKNLEIAFISYYKPILNEKHINTDFSKTRFVSQNLIDLGYTHLTIEMNFGEESIMGKIKTPNTNPTLEIDITL